MKLTCVLYTLLALLAIPCCAATREHPLAKSAIVDLDGDGKKEQVKIDIPAADFNTKYVLHIGQVSAKGTLWEGVDGFEVVDIDTSDHHKEIAVHTSGPSDDFGYRVYWYDGHSISDMAELPGSASFPGNGTVLVCKRIDFAFTTEKYALNKQLHKLNVVPQEIYHVTCFTEKGPADLQVTLTKSFPITFSRTSSQAVANLQPGKQITILGYSPAKRDASGGFEVSKDDRYLIISSTNLMGWASAKHIVYDNINDLPAFD